MELQTLRNNKYIKTPADVATCRLCGAILWRTEDGFIELHLRSHGIKYKKCYFFE